MPRNWRLEMTTILQHIKTGLRHEAAPGVLLVVSMIAALVCANSGVAWYDALLGTYAVVGIGEWEIEK